MKTVGITGASGLVGQAVASLCRERGFEVLPFVRGGETTDTQIGWDPRGTLSPPDLERVDVVVHLAGESIVGRWSEKKRSRILQSRVDGTKTLVDAINACEKPPSVFVCASAVGFYGSRGDEWVDETSERGEGFLADVVEAWEREANRCEIRTVNTRFGVILSPAGGALEKMLTPFKLGIGGPLGDGEQYMAWVTLDDTARAILFAATTETVSGPVNVVAPHPVTNAVFTKALGSALSRPTIFRLPETALRLALGDAADELLLYSQRVRPGVLTDAGFEFEAPQIEDALANLLRS